MLEIVPTWNCNDCDMPVTVAQIEHSMSCPHCGKSMFYVSD